MINELNKKDTLENIYSDLESGMPENKSIKEYALPNARQWLGGRFVAIWVLPIYFIRKFAKFSSSSAFPILNPNKFNAIYKVRTRCK